MRERMLHIGFGVAVLGILGLLGVFILTHPEEFKSPNPRICAERMKLSRAHTDTLLVLTSTVGRGFGKQTCQEWMD
jgi:hypothetical protein